MPSTSNDNVEIHTPLSSNTNKRSFSLQSTNNKVEVTIPAAAKNYTPQPPRPRNKKNKEEPFDELIENAMTTLNEIKNRPQEINECKALAVLLEYKLKSKSGSEKDLAIAKAAAFISTL